MSGFTPVAALLGGVLIGLAASIMLLLSGRVTGVSGIVGGLFAPARGDVLWRVLFMAGLVLGGLAVRAVAPALMPAGIPHSPWTIGAAGLLVGFGSRLGSGCTSGHGVCGLSRLSLRSVVATLTFMATGALTVYVARHVLGGAG